MTEPDNTLQLKNDIIKALNKGDLSLAKGLINIYVDESPNDYWGWMMLGGILKPEYGIEHLFKAQKLAPHNQEVIEAVQMASLKMAERLRREQKPAAAPTQIQQQTDLAQNDEDEQPGWFSWVKSGVLIILLIFLAILLAFGLSSFLRGSEPVILGHQMIIVTSGSMEPTFLTGSLILVNTSEKPPVYSEGDVVMFRSPDNPQTNVTHRIIEVRQDEEGTYYRTKGDNNDFDDPTPIRDRHIIGQYANITFPGLGYFFSFVKSRNGLILLAMAFGLFLIISQAVKIKEYLKGDEEG